MNKKQIADQLIRVRLAQQIVNERYKNGDFKIPIHLAFGHEAIAVAVDRIMGVNDQLILSHRNIHYNLARIKSLTKILAEYYLKKGGLAQGKLGSMNLANSAKNIIYTSSILGNNLSVATGLALGKKIQKTGGIVIVVTGDGAIEEGSFYETLVLLGSLNLKVLIVVENNRWSLATRIDQRRCPINLKDFCSALNMGYQKIKNNDVFSYIDKIKVIRNRILKDCRPFCLEVELHTLGDWILKNKSYPNGKYINYHAGPAPKVVLSSWPLIKQSKQDPVFVLQKNFSLQELKMIARKALNSLEKEICEIH